MKLNKTINLKSSEGRWTKDTPNYELTDSALKVHTTRLRTPNISSHTLVDLCDLNSFSSKGKTLLSIFGYLEKETIDPYQLIKGGIVEYFANEYLLELYGDRIDVESYTVQQFPDFNQFHHSPPFSGVLDKLLKSPVKLPVEIKSKEIKDYEYIATKGNYPKDHILQAMNQAYFINASRCMLIYGFLTEHANILLREFVDNGILEQIFGKNSNAYDYKAVCETLGFTRDMFIFDHKIFEVDNDLVENNRKKALGLYNEFYQTKEIPLSYFSKNELELLKKNNFQ